MFGSFYEAHPSAPLDVTTSLSGHGITGSLEAGNPFALTDDVELETQGQIIWQNIAFNGATDQFTTLAFNDDSSFTGRLGLQLQDNVVVGDGIWLQPRLLTNLWHTFSGGDTVDFNSVTPLTTPFGQTTFEVGGAVAGRFSDQLGAYAQFSYTTNVGGDYVQAIKGIIGIRYNW